MWNYRVIKHTDTDTDTVIYYQIHKVYYNNDDETKPESMTVDGIVPYGNTPDELSHSLIHMLSALTKPVLDATIFNTMRTDETHLVL
jgi:hypothetical protein